MQNRSNKYYKQPSSVLVIIHSIKGEILLLERSDHPGFWQSVTGSQEADENIEETARREVFEETGLAGNLNNWHRRWEYEIYPHWRHRYKPGTTLNTEHIFSLIISRHSNIIISPGEHLQYQWFLWQEAIEKVFSPSNAQAIQLLAKNENWFFK